MQILLVTPFITILHTFLLLKGLLPNPDDNPDFQQAMTLITSNLFAFFVLLGFSLCSGLYILQTVKDKENKLRHLLSFIGMKPLAYYLGSFMADLLMFIIPTLLLISLLYPLGVKYYIINGAWAQLIALMTSFGMCLITMTYLISFMFQNTDRAFRSIGIIYLLGGTFIPNFLGTLVVGISQSITVYKIFRYIMLANPFWNLNQSM